MYPRTWIAIALTLVGVVHGLDKPILYTDPDYKGKPLEIENLKCKVLLEKNKDGSTKFKHDAGSLKVPEKWKCTLYRNDNCRISSLSSPRGYSYITQPVEKIKVPEGERVKAIECENLGA